MNARATGSAGIQLRPDPTQRAKRR